MEIFRAKVNVILSCTSKFTSQAYVEVSSSLPNAFAMTWGSPHNATLQANLIKKSRLANSSSCCRLTTCKFFKLCITNTWKCINPIRVRPQYWYKKECRVRGPFFRKETLASASLYVLATTMQTNKTSLEREQKIGFAQQRPPTYARKWTLIKLSKYKPSQLLSLSSWLTRIS